MQNLSTMYFVIIIKVVASLLRPCVNLMRMLPRLDLLCYRIRLRLFTGANRSFRNPGPPGELLLRYFQFADLAEDSVSFVF